MFLSDQDRVWSSRRRWHVRLAELWHLCIQTRCLFNKKKKRKKEIPVFPAKLLFFCNQYFFIYIIFQRSEIICHLAELLTDRKEEILAANKTDMDQAVNTGRITRKSRNVSLRL